MAAKEQPREEDTGDGAEGEKKRGGKKLIIIIVAALLLLGGAGAGLYFSGMLNKFIHKSEKSDSAEGEKKEEGHEDSKEEAKSEEHGGSSEHASGEHGEKKEGKEPIPGAPTFVDLPSFLVNLNAAGATNAKQTSFLKMTATLELANAEDAAKLEAVMPRIIDNFNTYLRELRPADLAGSAGMTRLREELLLRVNKSAYPIQVKDILFKEMLVQ